MSDLISRSALLEDMKNELEKALNDECKVILTSELALKQFVYRQPTVEAIPKSKLDEIVEKLEWEKSDWNDDWNIPINRAIKIVKGVINERD